MPETKEPLLSVHNGRRLLRRLKQAGLDDELADKVASSKHNNLAEAIVALIEEHDFSGEGPEDYSGLSGSSFPEEEDDAYVTSFGESKL